MKTFPIGNSSTETTEFKIVNESTFALIQRVKPNKGDEYTVIILSYREVLNLYQAIQKEVLK